jgi:hypothetical protein
MAAWPGRSGEVEKVAQQLGELTDEKPSFRITVLTTMFQHAVAHLSHGCPNSRWVLLVPFDAETTSADDLSANLRMREGTTSADFVPALRELLLFATRRPECENDEALEAWLAGEPLEPLSHDTKPRHYVHLTQACPPPTSSCSLLNFLFCLFLPCSPCCDRVPTNRPVGRPLSSSTTRSLTSLPRTTVWWLWRIAR